VILLKEVASIRDAVENKPPLECWDWDKPSRDVHQNESWTTVPWNTVVVVVAVLAVFFVLAVVVLTC
jgi:hypothetical protein